MLPVHMFIVVMNMCHTMLSFINNALYVIIMFLIYGIKMIWKLPIILTIQKTNYNRHFSVRGFAAALNLDLFDGKNFLLWKAKMVVALLLT